MKRILSQRKLEAFYSLSRTGSFSKAANELCLTQSALSQRIALLEESLGRKLFIREKNSVEHTHAGERLLRFCHIKYSLEDELLNDIALSDQSQLSGSLTIACFSSLMRSAVMPTLSPLLLENPGIQIDLKTRDLVELPKMLYQSKADFIISQSPLDRIGFNSVVIGHEINVLIESINDRAVKDVYLDHNIGDHFNESFLRAQPDFSNKLIKRAFVGDIYGMIDGISLGLGRGVVPMHLLRDIKNIRQVGGSKSQDTPCLLHYSSSPCLSKLHLKVIELLTANFSKYLIER